MLPVFPPAPLLLGAASSGSNCAFQLFVFSITAIARENSDLDVRRPDFFQNLSLTFRSSAINSGTRSCKGSCWAMGPSSDHKSWKEIPIHCLEMKPEIPGTHASMFRTRSKTTQGRATSISHKYLSCTLCQVLNRSSSCAHQYSVFVMSSATLSVHLVTISTGAGQFCGHGCADPPRDRNVTLSTASTMPHPLLSTSLCFLLFQGDSRNRFCSQVRHMVSLLSVLSVNVLHIVANREHHTATGDLAGLHTAARWHISLIFPFVVSTGPTSLGACLFGLSALNWSPIVGQCTTECLTFVKAKVTKSLCPFCSCISSPPLPRPRPPPIQTQPSLGPPTCSVLSCFSASTYFLRKQQAAVIPYLHWASGHRPIPTALHILSAMTSDEFLMFSYKGQPMFPSHFF